MYFIGFNCIVNILYHLLIFMMVESIDISNEYDTQYGVSIASINVNGFISSKEKRMQLNLWLHKNEIDTYKNI